MRTQGKAVDLSRSSGTARSDDAAIPECPGRAPVPVPASDCTRPAEQLRQRKYRELARKHLNRLLSRLFAELTGLRFHIAWKPVSLAGQPFPLSPTRCSEWCRRSGAAELPECQTCGTRHLDATMASAHGHCFTCGRGIRNFWFPLQVGDETLAIAYLQQSEQPSSAPRSASAETHQTAAVRHEDLAVDHLSFDRAARFLRHIVEHVETASLSDLRKADLSSAGRAMIALEREQARLHEALKRQLPTSPATVRRCTESHAEQIVHAVLQRIELNYPQPLTLRRLARDLSMNGAYLSTLFSHTVGIPFKAYLTDLRLQKAKALLADFTKTTSDVAFATGYSSQERFRSAFKKATGLSPKAWRETMQPNPS